MRRIGWIAALLLALGMGGMGMPAAAQEHASSSSSPEEELLAADRAFAAATAEKGAEGWASYFTEDGVQLPVNGPLVRGRQKIQEFMAPGFSNPDLSLTWEPVLAAADADGGMGYTVGNYTVKRKGKDGKVAVTQGRYVTLWRKGADGAWKVVLDAGNPGPPVGEKPAAGKATEGKPAEGKLAPEGG